MTLDDLLSGHKIRFKGEVQRYTVQAAGPRYLVCSKPFNPKKTVLYTVVDKKLGIRGTESLVFPFGAETKEQCEEMLARLEYGVTEVSYRNRVDLEIEQLFGYGE